MSFVMAEIIVTGIVQGVGFRYFCLTHARKLNLNGWVKNLPDGSVITSVEGEQESVELYLNLLQSGSDSSAIDKTEIKWLPYTGQFISFEITH